MNSDSSTKCWNEIGDEWIQKAQTNDFRIFYIMPNTFELLGDVNKKAVLDLGCGEGGYARELARKGANVVAVDCSNNAVEYAIAKAVEEELQIKHYVRNSNDLYGINDNTFDIVLCAMMLMDVEDLNGTLQEIHRVLKPQGKVFISILHPCFKPPIEHQWFKEDDGIQVRVKNYFSPSEWEGQISNIENKVIYRHKTISEYVKAFVQNCFIIKDMNEPIPTPEQQKKSSRIEWLAKIPMYLFITLEKPI